MRGNARKRRKVESQCLAAAGASADERGARTAHEPAKDPRGCLDLKIGEQEVIAIAGQQRRKSAARGGFARRGLDCRSHVNDGFVTNGILPSPPQKAEIGHERRRGLPQNRPGMLRKQLPQPKAQAYRLGHTRSIPPFIFIPDVKDQRTREELHDDLARPRISDIASHLRIVEQRVDNGVQFTGRNMAVDQPPTEKPGFALLDGIENSRKQLFIAGHQSVGTMR